jgi:glycerol dehydrogenase-like iron-containing ADH family enzyme
MDSRGFGDTVAKVTKATGIKFITDKVSEVLDVDCGCAARQKSLNKIIPYKKQNGIRKITR